MKIFSNSKLTSWIIIVLIVSNVISISALVVHIVNNKDKVLLSKMHHADSQKKPHHKGNCFFDKMDLTEEQREEFTELKESFMVEVNTIMIELKEKRHAILSELNKENPDSLKLTQLTQDIGSLHTGLKLETIDFYLKIKKDCTPEQEEQLYQMFKMMNQRHMGHHLKREKDIDNSFQ